jgi:hypothetical protein
MLEAACRKWPEKMPTSSTFAFSDPADFQSALHRRGVVSLTPTQVVGFRVRLTEVRLSQLELMAAREYVSRIAIVSAPTDQVLTAFPLTDEGVHYWDERRLSLGELVVVTDPAHGTWRISAPTSWGAILLPKRLLVDCWMAIVGEKAHLPPPGLTLWRPRWPTFRDLLKLNRAVVRHTVRQPEAPIETEAARGLEQELLSSLVESLADMSPKPD